MHNSLPKYLRDIRVKTDEFEYELDKFLELIRDEPKMDIYVTASRSNSILDQLYLIIRLEESTTIKYHT